MFPVCTVALIKVFVFCVGVYVQILILNYARIDSEGFYHLVHI